MRVKNTVLIYDCKNYTKNMSWCGLCVCGSEGAEWGKKGVANKIKCFKSFV